MAKSFTAGSSTAKPRTGRATRSGDAPLSRDTTRKTKPENAGPQPQGVYYQTRDVVDLLGISRRQLQYWSQTDLVTPSATTPGGHRRYSFEDLVALKAAKRLIDAGVSVQRIRSSIRSLRETLPGVDRPLSELVLVATGDIVLVFRDGAAFEAVSGQEWVFEVAAFQREVERWRSATGKTASKGKPGKERRAASKESRTARR
jgi:DNA-binding transcriptional MerR regulator